MEMVVEVETLHFGKVSLKVEQIVSDNPGVDGYFFMSEKPKEFDLIGYFFDSMEDLIQKVKEYDQNFSLFHKQMEPDNFFFHW